MSNQFLRFPIVSLTVSLIVSFVFTLPMYSQDAKGDTYPLTVHVSRSEVIFMYTGSLNDGYERIETTIDGRHYTLLGIRPATVGVKPTVLKTGDYKARVVEEKNMTSATYYRQYEFKLSDGSKLKFDIVGESE